MKAGRSGATLSVVVGSHNARASIEDCLSALIEQRTGDDVEIIVVDNSTDGTAEIIERGFPDVRLVSCPASVLIPELWETGIGRARGDIVAITTAHCVPAKDWIAGMLGAHNGAVAAVGGAIESDENASLVDWAVYFCRYSQYMLPFEEGFAPEIAGDNASYKRAQIDGCREAWRGGFWEPAVHAELRKAGHRLLLTPAVVVYHRRSFDLPGFMKQRFLHGIQFGRDRAARLSGPKRLFYIASSPAIPLVFFFRISRQVLRKRRHTPKYLASLPLLVPFLLAWASGELVGYLRGRRE